MEMLISLLKYIYFPELCQTFPYLKRSAQSVMAIVLHKAIWNWIEHYPAEFVQLAQSQKRLEGGPEILFDICNNLADNPRRKAVFWPLQTMLLILCPDVLLTAAMTEGRGTPASKRVCRRFFFFFFCDILSEIGLAVEQI